MEEIGLQAQVSAEDLPLLEREPRRTPLRIAPLGGVHAAEAIEVAGAHAPEGNLPRGVPPRTVGLELEREVRPRRERVRRPREEVVAARLLRGDEGPVSAVHLAGEVAGEGPTRLEREEHQPAPGAEAASAEGHLVAPEVLAGVELHGARGGEVAVLRGVRALGDVESLHHLGDDEVQVGVALAMAVAHHVDRQPVDGEREVGPVVEVEPPQEELVGLASPGVLHGEEARRHLEDVRERKAPLQRSRGPPGRKGS